MSSESNMRDMNEENDLQLKKFLIVKQILVTFFVAKSSAGCRCILD